MIYVARARKTGMFEVALSCLRRALKLYGVHIATTATALAIFGLASYFTGLDDVVAVHGRSLIFDDPARGASGIALLSHQIGYFNILPLYIALMVWAPIAVALTLARPWVALAVSSALYVAARGLGWNPPTWPQDGHWFFNPLAWQLLFTCGVVAADFWRHGPPRLSPPLAFASAALLIAGAVIVTDGFGLAPGLRDGAFPLLDQGKQDLGVGRMAHFFALAYLVAALPSLGRFASAPLGEGLRRMGRHSLPIFAIGSLLCAVGQALTGVASHFLDPTVVHASAMLYTVVAIGASFLLAKRLECQTPFPFVSSLLGIFRWLSRRHAKLQPSSQRG